jgi:hypothetical protein
MRQGPGLEHSIHFQPQVIVETSCAMSLNKKAVPLLMTALIGRLWGLGKDSFSPVFF